MDLDKLLLHDGVKETLMEALPLPPSSEVLGFLTRNDPPSDDIRSAVLAKIQQYQHFIFLVKSSGHRMDLRYQSTTAVEKTKAEKLLVDLRSIVHPIRSVPDDVLLEIFAVIVDSMEASSVSTDMDLWACARVCQLWRSLVLGTPSLWSDVRLNFDDDIYLRYRVSRAERILVERLQRSRNNLLDVFVCGPHAHPDTNGVLSRLLTSAARWRLLTVDAGPEVYEIFEKCPEGSMSELLTLSITDSVFMDAAFEEEDRYTGVILNAFHFTPKLRRLFLSPLPLLSLSLHDDTIYGNIEDFSVNLYDQLTDVSCLLPHMWALKSLDILCDEGWPEDDDTVRLPLLTRITLRDCNYTRNIPDTWSKLYLPNVTSLQLAYEGIVLHPRFPLFDKHNTRITDLACHVKSFAESEFPDFERDLIVMLRSLPNITNLRLSCCHTTPVLLEEIRSDTRFLHDLTDITLLWKIPSSEVPDDDVNLLIDTLYTRARSATCATVKRIVLESEIIIYGGPTPYSYMWEELQNRGLEAIESWEPLF